jgi:gamma-glutamylcyclotransferase (GGCT)/AIG2-like uncharacterized protein YtfP
MSDALFTYGTLQIPEVMEAVAGRVLSWVGAEAPGFAQFRFTDRIYPGMIPRAGSTTQGRVYIPLSLDVWKILDRFEDPIYRRSLIEVYQADGSSMTAHAYILPADQQHLLSSDPWQMAWFVETQLEGYVNRCRLFYQAITSEHSSSSLLPASGPRSAGESEPGQEEAKTPSPSS